jgi:hypothetical protein
MARIQLYDRNIPSALVGTPGVTRAGSELMSISQDIASLTADQIKLDAAKIEIADNIEAEKYRIEFENQYYQKMEDAKQEGIQNPYGVADQAYSIGSDYASDMAQEISNPRVRDIFLGKAQNSLESYQGKIRGWASKTTTDNAYINLSNSMELLETQAGSIKNASDLEGLVNSAEELAFNSAAVVGVERANKVFEATRKGIYENFAYSNIDANPNAVKVMVDKGVFNGVLDEKEQLSLKNSADSLIRKREAEIKRQNASAHIDTIATLYEKEMQGTLTLKEVDTAIAAFKQTGAGIGNLKSLYSIKKSLLGDDGSSSSGSGRRSGGSGGGSRGGRGASTKVSYREQVDTMVDISNKYLAIFDKTGAGGTIKKKAAGYVTLGDLSKLQNEIVSAVEAKKLDKATGNAMIKNIIRGKQALSGTNRSVTSRPGFFKRETKDVPIAIYNEGMRSIYSWADRNIPNANLRNEFKYEALTSFAMQYDDARKNKNFNMNGYTNQIISYYARKYGKSVQLKKVK